VLTRVNEGAPLYVQLAVRAALNGDVSDSGEGCSAAGILRAMRDFCSIRGHRYDQHSHQDSTSTSASDFGIKEPFSDVRGGAVTLSVVDIAYPVRCCIPELIVIGGLDVMLIRNIISQSSRLSSVLHRLVIQIVHHP
jgi:hypothetical protein